MEYYTLKLFGFRRELPIVRVGPKLSVASFSLLGDVELVDVLAQELVERIKYLNFDYLVGTETKILPLVYQMGHLLGSKNYIITRQRVLSYMTNPIKSNGKKPLVLNGPDAKLLKGKKVVIVSDVISSQKTVTTVENLLKKVDAKVIALASVLKQGDEKFDTTIPFFYLHHLPLLNND
jgi:adenine phosphoribosyltransferase